jgi:hypothetical protein
LYTDRAKALLRRTRCGLSLTSAVLAGCLAGSHQTSTSFERPVAPEPGGLQIPGTYTTSRSCGSEWGDGVVLTLLPAGLFSLRQTYRDLDCGESVTLVYPGRWTIADNGHELRLDNGPVWLRRLMILNHRTLRIPDRAPAAIPPHRVVQTASRTPLLPFRDPFHLRGLGTFATVLE